MRARNQLFALCFLKSRDAAAIFGEVLVGGEGLENLSLAEGQKDLFIICSVGNYKVFNLREECQNMVEMMACERVKVTSSPQSKASRSLPLALFQISRSCCAERVRCIQLTRLQCFSSFYKP